MDTAAKGALEFFKTGDTVDDSGNPVSRRETPEEAAALDDQMWAVWQSHPHHHRVGNSHANSSQGDNDSDGTTHQQTMNPFQIKLAATARAVEAICNAHYQQ